MHPLRRSCLILLLFSLCSLSAWSAQQAQSIYVHFEHQQTPAYGLLQGETIKLLSGSLFDQPTLTSQGQLAIIHHYVYYSANIIRIGGIHWILKLAHYT